MARSVKPHEYEEKRKQILDVAQQCIYRKGYAQLTIQDLLDTLQISKGAFYHYFDSKQALLDALIERLGDQAVQIFDMIMGEPDLSPIARLQRFFDATGRWKTTQKQYLFAVLRAWYADDNALVRLHGQAIMAQRITPRIGALIAAGVAQGELSTPFPDQAGAMVQALMTSMGDAFAALLLSDQPRPQARTQAEQLVAAYNDALDRLLGAPPGSLSLIDSPTLQTWFEVHAAGEEPI